MTDNKYGVVALGNALVDVLAHADEDFIESEKQFGMVKGGMTLIDEPRAHDLYNKMSQGVEVSGGSAGNTMACFASFGGKGAFIAKVADDQLGEIFKHDLNAMGVDFDTSPLQNGPATGRCLILVTPDGERTMNTFLGASVEFSPEDVNEDLIKQGQILYLEGYLFDKEAAKQAFRKASKIAKEAGKKVALTLSDSFCVDRHREDFKDLIDHHVDILFANEDEIVSLYETQSFEEAQEMIASKNLIAALTRSEKGSVIVKGNETYKVEAEPVEKVVDSTGAGDAYAAGFLFGYTEGMDFPTCGQLGSIAAAEVISHIGPRPEADLSTLIRKKAA